MWLPEKVYESLPTTYVMIGALNIVGAMYIGVSDGLMLGHVFVGLACMTAGIFVSSLRQNTPLHAASAPAPST